MNSGGRFNITFYVAISNMLQDPKFSLQGICQFCSICCMCCIDHCKFFLQLASQEATALQVQMVAVVEISRSWAELMLEVGYDSCSCTWAVG